ncbi:TetR/AcrR family transcriptional regulator [Frankia sp. CNm7]|uniref:TetR/AcrR family transcriptional regulator n=1 Tax=Frankia nepalensis TaxID=1836974 RepID=A0A937RDZ2_9ACTN|nr:TetR/AcrR family transcriptional regulator [Frankia nepalensis]MBL7500803.1 TetR/AcrR family transcriptional regulator [Frankia nepalensis]MBL7512610.1 TetR/AcrR family transcriptional regulator [Frankia nepalensis]MBL7523050.1 TetR/AcrR family transcriptional regulator [Frankia nepalensis]MBL7628197.1 TetR/AcrR family transcriptional regulator [Frankia nepalensis]
MSPESRRSEILDTAASMFARLGVKTSLKAIADECGIQAGSLYHHFESREAIIAELVERFHANLGEIAAKALDTADGETRPDEALIAFGNEIAASAVRHRAALLLTHFKAPADDASGLRPDSRTTSPAVHTALLSILGTAREQGVLRADLDLDAVADRFWQGMLHVGIGVYHRTRAARGYPELKCRVILDGLAARPREYDGSAPSEAHRAMDELIADWEAPEAAPLNRAAVIRESARAEFAKRGFETATMRDVAAAARLALAAVYREFESKDALLASIMESYVSFLTDGWNRVVHTSATPLDKIDSLMWFAVNVIDRFREEHRIQSFLLQQAPPDSANLSLSFPAMLGQVTRLLAEGDEAGQFQLAEWPADARARAVFSLLWTPENIVRGLGPKGALELARDTVLRGVRNRTADTGSGASRYPASR